LSHAAKGIQPDQRIEPFSKAVFAWHRSAGGRCRLAPKFGASILQARLWRSTFVLS
jgi:hypothetical protein